MVAGHVRRAVLTEGMFIYTTMGEGETAPVSNFTTNPSLIVIPRQLRLRLVLRQQVEVLGFSSEHGMVNKGVHFPPGEGSFLFPKFQLRGRFRVSSDAKYTSLGEVISNHSKSRNAPVYGLDLDPNPNAVNTQALCSRL